MIKNLNKNQIRVLREKGVINENESVFYSGDLIVAENVITRERRILNDIESILSESKRILKG